MEVSSHLANDHQENHPCGPKDAPLDLLGGTPMDEPMMKAKQLATPSPTGETPAPMLTIELPVPTAGAQHFSSAPRLDTKTETECDDPGPEVVEDQPAQCDPQLDIEVDMNERVTACDKAKKIDVDKLENVEPKKGFYILNLTPHSHHKEAEAKAVAESQLQQAMHDEPELPP